MKRQDAFDKMRANRYRRISHDHRKAREAQDLEFRRVKAEIDKQVAESEERIFWKKLEYQAACFPWG